MYIDPQGLLYVVGAICLLWVGGFLCWALYETARFMRQANGLLEEIQERVDMVEAFVDDLIKKASALTGYLDILMNVGDTLSGFLGRGRGEAKTKEKKKRKLLSRSNEDEE
ncbi:MAG: hypothetical protein AAB668_01525 [Patescibacteria group bacterium]